MVVHIVLFQFKEEEKIHLDEAVRHLLSMKGRVEVIQDIKAGKDFLHSGRSWDLAVVVTFANPADLEVYDNHADHQPVKQFLRPLLEKSASVDFEI